MIQKRLQKLWEEIETLEKEKETEKDSFQKSEIENKILVKKTTIINLVKEYIKF